VDVVDGCGAREWGRLSSGPIARRRILDGEPLQILAARALLGDAQQLDDNRAHSCALAMRAFTDELMQIGWQRQCRAYQCTTMANHWTHTLGVAQRANGPMMTAGHHRSERFRG